MKKVLALALAAVMVMALVGAASADTASVHTITIKNDDQYVSHTYTAYQVFVGNADSAKTKLANIAWGNGVSATGIITDLKAVAARSTLAPLKALVASIDTSDATAVAGAARTIAEALTSANGFSSTNGATAAAGALDDFAAIVAKNVSSTGVGLTEAAAGKTYTGNVTGDGYYLIIDSTTGSLSITDYTNADYMGSDTLSKNILIPVFDNVEANAKDTHIKPDKEILKANGQSFDRVKEGTAAIGDVVTFEVSIPVPNTAKYQKGFTFEMNDTLPAGMTFKQLVSVKVGNDDVPNILTVKEANGTTDFAPAANADLVTTTGGQKIHIDFKDASHDFKYYSEDKGWYGFNLVVTYTAVVNKDADLTPTGNLNEVTFTYANDPNHAYDGTEQNPPTGTTPKDKTKTVLANIDIYKTDGTKALAGAEFEITSTDYNVTLVTGEKFEASTAANPYVAAANETILTGTYYKLTDGTFTTTAYTTSNASYYVDDTTYVKVSFTKTVTTPGTTNKVTVISGEDGHIKLEGVKPGTYQIKETKAPLGFNLDPDTHTIVISESYNASTKTISLNCTSTGVTWDGSTATASITIVNNSGTTLPSTGGIGTTIFYVSGLIMVLGASIILVARRRADAE